MASIFNELINNLELQMQAMVDDNVQEIISLVTEQEILADRLQKTLSTGEPLSPEQEAQLRRLSQLLESNQLLAQQSLSFARRMIKLLGGEEHYNAEGLSSSKLKSSSRVDIRA